MEKKPNQFTQAADFKEGVLLLIDKPKNWTSFDVVNKVRNQLRWNLKLGKKIKVGHAGTLDPMATGLLVLCTGKMTKQIQYLQAEDKSYTGTMVLGATTPSYDTETVVNETYEINHLTEQQLHEAAASFLPGYDQIAPAFSAKKVDGKRAYLSARKGIDPKIAPRSISLHKFELTDFNLPEVQFDAVCSKGTYIRSLAYDLGRKVENGAYLNALRRYASGEFSIDDALTLEQFEARISQMEPFEEISEGEQSPTGNSPLA